MRAPPVEWNIVFAFRVDKRTRATHIDEVAPFMSDPTFCPVRVESARRGDQRILLL